jgi:molybdopterin molybdotransferase
MIGRKKMSGFPNLMSVDEALAVIKGHLSIGVEVDEVALEDALDMVAGEDIRATWDVPPFDRSAVEGYAVMASDTISATPTNVVELAIVGRSEAGSRPQDLPIVAYGKCVEIFTGGPLPSGANAVVMVEHTKRMDDVAMILRPVAPWQNISRRGEDFAAGDVIVQRGTRLRPWHIGALASVNVVKLRVQRGLKVAVLSTGDELKEPGEKVEAGDILNSSKPMLKALIRDRGCMPLDLGTVPDELERIKAGIAQGLMAAALVLTTGGTSLGEKDLVPEAVNELGQPGVVVHGVLMRPAKPTGVGFIGTKPIFMLSGYPVAALIGFEAFVDPAINYMRATPPEVRPVVRARLDRRVATSVGVRSYIRARLHREGAAGYIAEPLRLTGSGILSSMTKANGILVVNEQLEGYDEGDEVEVTVIGPIDEI